MIVERVGNKDVVLMGVYTMENNPNINKSIVTEELDIIESVAGVRYSEEEMDVLYEIFHVSEFAIGIYNEMFYIVDFYDLECPLDELKHSCSMCRIIEYALDLVEDQLTSEELNYLVSMRDRALAIV